MSSARNSIGGLETAMLTAAAVFAAGVFIAPRLLVADAGRAAGLALVLVSLLVIAWTWEMARRATRVEGRDLPRALLRRGGWAGRAWLMLVALVETALAGQVLTTYAAMAAAVVLPGSSRLEIVVLIAAAAYTAARHRIEGLARAVFVAFLAAALMALLAFALLLARGEQLATVWPGPHLAAVPILNGAFDGLLLYGGSTAIVAFLPAHKSKGVPGVVSGTVLAFVLIAVAFAGTLATGGPNFVLTQVWPVVSALRTLVLASFVLNRFGLIVVLAWSAFALTFAAVHIWVATEYTCLAAGSDRWRGLVAFAATALAVLVTTRLPSLAAFEGFARGVVVPAVFAVFIIWLVLAFVLTWRRPRQAES